MKKWGVIFVFAVPIWAISCVVGILIGNKIPVSALFIFIAAVFSFVVLLQTKNWAALIVFGLLFGVVRGRWGDALYFMNHTIFTEMRNLCDGQLSRFLDDPYKTLVSGVLFGGSSNFSPEWKRVFRATGIMHVVAVSGANIAFVIRWFELLMKKIGLTLRTKFYTIVLFVGMYILMTGAPASVVRAGIMAFIMHVAPLLGRRAYSAHALSVAVIVMIVINPSIAQDIGFQFSCLATAGLIIFEAPTTKFAAMVSETIAATLCILPLEILYFKTISMSALAANLVIAPVVPVIMLGGICILAVSFLANSIAFAGASTLQYLLAPVLRLLAQLADFRGSYADAHVSVVFVIIWYGALLFYAIHRFKKKLVKTSKV